MVNGTKIKKLREEHELGLEALSKAVGSSHNMIYYVEQGLRQPSVTLLENIANYFKVSCDYLLDRDSPGDTA